MTLQHSPDPAAKDGKPLKKVSRIQRQNRRKILDAALDVFATAGFHGGTIDRIAEISELSKPNILYYFPSKEAIHSELLAAQLGAWMEPLAALGRDGAGTPLEQLLAYVARKLDMSRTMPRESRLFASEIFTGAPRLQHLLTGDLRTLVDDKARLIESWAEAGAIAPVDARHLLFAIWALTQHYADFEHQVRAVLGDNVDPFDEAGRFLRVLFQRLLSPREDHLREDPGRA